MADVEIALEELMRTTASGTPYGITEVGFVPKSVSRLLEEKLAAARVLFGNDLDLTSGSTIRKLCELLSLEEARFWEHLGIAYADSFISTATGDALSMLGEELGIPRPHHLASGTVTVKIEGDLPGSYALSTITLPRGTRLLSDGGHDYFIDDSVSLNANVKSVDVAVMSFNPGPRSNLDPGISSEQLKYFNDYDSRSNIVRTLADEAGADVLTVVHTAPTAGGELFWSDESYRDLLLSYPRNLWTPDAVRVAVSLVPGVRQVLVKDLYGGLDINQSIFANFNFIERLFSEERSLGDPYYFTVLVAPGEGAIWAGPGELYERVNAAIEKVRPIGILPKVESAAVVGVSFTASIAVEGVPIPGGSPTAINGSPEALALKQRIFDRVRRYVQALGIGEPVRYAEVLWAIMEEPGVVDAKQVHLIAYPPVFTDVGSEATSMTDVGSEPASVSGGSAVSGLRVQKITANPDIDIDVDIDDLPTDIETGPIFIPGVSNATEYGFEEDAVISPTQIADLVENFEGLTIV